MISRLGFWPASIVNPTAAVGAGFIYVSRGSRGLQTVSSVGETEREVLTAAWPSRRRHDLSVAHDDEYLGDHQSDALHEGRTSGFVPARAGWMGESKEPAGDPAIGKEGGWCAALPACAS
jgi:hypothetical protein